MAKDKASKRPGKLGVVLMALLLVITIIANVACGMFSNVISQFFGSVDVDMAKTEQASVKGHELSEQVSQEGIVLLENKGAALPLDLSDERQMNVNVFGWSSVSPLYSATGSASGNNENAVSVIDGLNAQGFSVNQELYDFYQNSGIERSGINMFGYFLLDYSKPEVPVADYPDELWEQTRNYSDVAIIFIARTGGEGLNDIPTSMADYGGEADEHYLELSQDERALISKVVSLDFEKVIVVINTGQPMELGFLEEDGIDAALWIGYGGEDSMPALAKILCGDVNPSGRLSETYPYDAYSSAAVQNHGKFNYTNVSGGVNLLATGNFGYLNYDEGIYVGYRYYETAAADGFIDYDTTVQYPFGYGLSYTDFEQEISGFDTSSDGTISVKVTVTNTGEAAGKDVVQLYVTPPYTLGGIEKAHVNLVAFDKTRLLAPGESQVVELTINEEDMASYDYQGYGCYVLEEGTYLIKLMGNSHDVIDSRTYDVAATVVYGESNARSTDLVAAVNRFDDTVAEGQVFLSRADWAGTWPQTAPRETEASAAVVTALTDNTAYEDASAEDITFADNGLTLADMVGLDYDDPQWDLLLEQLSVADMRDLIGYGGYATHAVESVGKPYTLDLDGPGGIRSLVQDTVFKTVGYPTAVLIASTWNPDLVEEMAAAFGAEANAWGVSGLYGPSMNIRREPFGGRDAEFYSEDGLLSGKMAAAFVRGIQSQGVYCYIKHFVTFEQVGNASLMCTWVNEQALREIYLKPFELCVKEADAHAIMTCYNLLGTTWSGANPSLMVDVLRSEWGFEGMAITDAFRGAADINKGIRSGTDLALLTFPLGNIPADSGPVARQAMRRACHDILYTVANSNALEIGLEQPKATWVAALVVLDVVVVALEALYFVRRRKKIAAIKQQ